MTVFKAYLETIKDDEHRRITEEVLEWVSQKYPQLDKKIAWSQPHFVHKDTFIIAFTHAKQHLSVVPEYKAIEVFKTAIKDSGYLSTNFIYKMKWEEPFNYDLLSQIIEYNLEDKKDATTYWRKSSK